MGDDIIRATLLRPVAFRKLLQACDRPATFSAEGEENKIGEGEPHIRLLASLPTDLSQFKPYFGVQFDPIWQPDGFDLYARGTLPDNLLVNVFPETIFDCQKKTPTRYGGGVPIKD